MIFPRLTPSMIHDMYPQHLYVLALISLVFFDNKLKNLWFPWVLNGKTRNLLRIFLPSTPKSEKPPTEEHGPILYEHNGEERSTIDETFFPHQDPTYLNFYRKPIYPLLERCNAVITKNPPWPIYATIIQNDSFTPNAPILKQTTPFLYLFCSCFRKPSILGT